MWLLCGELQSAFKACPFNCPLSEEESQSILLRPGVFLTGGHFRTEDHRFDIPTPPLYYGVLTNKETEMKLLHSKIPIEFLHTLPRGIKFFSKHGLEFLVVEELRCPRGCSLMSDSISIHNEPAIHIQVTIGADSGALFIDSYWGSHIKLSSFLPTHTGNATIIAANCPNCGESLIVRERCSQEGCEAQHSIQFALPDGENGIFICTMFGCPGHRIEIKSQPVEVCKTVSNINYFGAQHDDLFGGI